MKKRFIFLLLIFLFPVSLFSQEGILYAEGRVLSKEKVEDIESLVDLEAMQSTGMDIVSAYKIQVEVNTGKYSGQKFSTDLLNSEKSFEMNPGIGEQVILGIEEGIDKKILGVYIVDHVRRKPLYLLIALFVLSILIIGGIKGFKSFISLVITLSMIFGVLIPKIIAGASPVFYSIVVCIFSSLVTFLIISGFNKKSLSSIFGTIAGFVAAGILAHVFSDIMYLKGVMDSETRVLAFTLGDNLDVGGLIFAGIVIGALGALMDVAISISSSIWEVKEQKPDLDFMGLYQSGMNVGKDILGTMTNTLILAYIGGSLSLTILMVANKTQLEFLQIINLEFIATEVLRAVVGSVGMLVTIPLTSAIAAFLYCIPEKKS